MNDRIVFEKVADKILQNPWVDEIYFEAVNLHKSYFLQYFNKNWSFFYKKISETIFEVMVNTKDTSEENYLLYKKLDKDYITNDVFMVSYFWIIRNYYKAIKITNSYNAKSIFDNALNMYSDFQEDEKITQSAENDIYNAYLKLKTNYGKIKLIQKVWTGTFSQNNFNYATMYNNYKDQILKVLDISLKEENKAIIENLCSIIMAICYDYSIDCKEFKREINRILAKYPKNLTKEISEILE